MNVIELATKMIKQHEGFMSKVYTCPAGYLSIGYGRNLETNPLTEAEKRMLGVESYSNQAVINHFKNVSITRDQAEQLLKNVVNNLVQILGDYNFYTNTHPMAKVGLIDMAYNMGVGRLLTFRKMIKALERQDYIEAGYQAIDSKWFRQVTRRANHVLYCFYSMPASTIKLV